MDIEFWQQRWEQNQTAFHLPTSNPYLTKYLSKFSLQTGDKIFIPLCGKSLDIVWLAAQNYSVIGIECSEKAIKSFFTENDIPVKIKNINQYKVYQSENIRLLQGDFFVLNEKDLEDVSVVYDRASLIALPEALRCQYVNLLNKTLPEKAEIFLITLEYNQSKMSGPPFSVDDDEVKKLFSSDYAIDILDEVDVLDAHQRFKERGLDYLIERVYRMTK